MLIVYGRRRVGKTELIEQAYRERNLIKLEGLEGEDEEYQRQVFADQIARYPTTHYLTITHKYLSVERQREEKLLVASLYF